jgi:RNA polymerase sigma-70 factor (ECF subfamily)
VIQKQRASLINRNPVARQPTLRSVVEIHQSNDRSVKEIADLAGISVAATKSRLLRARKILRRTLAAN